MKTLFLNPPSYEGFDGGAGSRYQARREVRSFWYPTWLAQAAALVPDSTLIDAPADELTLDDVLGRIGGHELVILHTSTPSVEQDAKTAAALKAALPGVLIGFVGAHTMVLPEETLRGAPAVDFVTTGEFDYAVRDIAAGADLADVRGIAYRTADGAIARTAPQPPIHDLDNFPYVTDIYHRHLTIEHYYIGYLQHPYVSLYTGRGCRSRCTFCLWPQTIAGHTYRTRSPEHVVAEMAHAQKLFPQVKEFFFDDDTFTANLPRAREIARKLAPLGLTWSCNSRANLDYDTISFFKDCGLRLFLVGYESGNDETLKRIKKGVTTDEMRHFTKACHKAGVVIHGTFILGLPVETRETIEQTINFAKDLDVFSLQVSLAAPYPGTELFEQARLNGWFTKKDKGDLVEGDGFQQSTLEYPGLDKDQIFAALEEFYHRYYFNKVAGLLIPRRPSWRIFGSMLQDKDVFLRRAREGAEFFKSLAQRRDDLAAQRSGS